MYITPVHKHSIVEYDCELLSMKECHTPDDNIALPESDIYSSYKFPYMKSVVENGKSYIYNIYGKKSYTKYCSCPLWDNHSSVFYIDRKSEASIRCMVNIVVIAGIVIAGILTGVSMLLS